VRARSIRERAQSMIDEFDKARIPSASAHAAGKCTTRHVLYVRRRNRSSFISIWPYRAIVRPCLSPKLLTHGARSIFIDRGIDDMWQLKFSPVGRKIRNNALRYRYVQCNAALERDDGDDAERIRNPSCSVGRHVTAEASYEDCARSVTFLIYLFVLRCSAIFPFRREDFMLRSKSREIMRAHVTSHYYYKKCDTVFFYLPNYPTFLSNNISC